MKKILFLSTLILSIQIFSFNSSATDLAINSEDFPPPRSLTLIPVSVDYTESDLTTEFLYNVGASTITVTDENGSVVYQTSVNAAAGTIVTISTEFWDAGTYKIKIQKGSKAYSGYFNVMN